MVKLFAKDDCPSIGNVNEDLYKKRPTRSRNWGLSAVLQSVRNCSPFARLQWGSTATTPGEKFSLEASMPVGAKQCPTVFDILEARCQQEQSSSTGLKNAKVPSVTHSSQSAAKDSAEIGSSSVDVSIESLDTSGTQTIVNAPSVQMQNRAAETAVDLSKTESSSGSPTEPRRILRKKRFEETESVVPSEDRDDASSTSASNASDDGNSSEGSKKDENKQLRRTTRVIRPVIKNETKPPVAKKSKPIVVHDRHETMTMEAVVRYDKLIQDAGYRMHQIILKNLVHSFYHPVSIIQENKEQTFDVPEKITRESLETLILTLELTTIPSIWTGGTLKERDIAKGKEVFPVKAYDYTDSEKPVVEEDFEYIDRNDYSQMEKPLPESEDYLVHCNCEGDCGINCPCVRHSIVHGNAVIIGNKIFVRTGDYWNCAVIACGHHCRCKGCCSNSLKKSAVSKHLDLIRHNQQLGYGVRTRIDISIGTLVFEFMGEVKDTDNVNQDYSWRTFDTSNKESLDGYVSIYKKIRGKDKIPRSWMSKEGRVLHIDPHKKGNIGRFVCHAETPNCIPIRVFINDIRPQMARLMFIASTNIPKDTELFSDYGSGYELPQCLCHTALCGDSAKLLRILQEDLGSKLVTAILQAQYQEIGFADSFKTSTKTIAEKESDMLKLSWLFNVTKEITGSQIIIDWSKTINRSVLTELIVREQKCEE